MNGAIAWFARNRVAANLLLLLVAAGGAATIATTKLEVFPEFALDLITIDVEYRGAAPEEVEEAVCVRVEEAIQGIDGVKRVTSVAREGWGSVTVELLTGTDSRKALDDVKSRVDAIDTFPEETEEPVVQELTNRREVVDVAIYGPADERTLKYVGQRVRDDIASLPGITLAELATARPYEISIEVSEDDLRRWGLTFDAVAERVRRSSLDLPGGGIKTPGGEILLRTEGQAYRGPEFEERVLLTRPDGTAVRLGDVATVVDGFEEVDVFSRFEGQPAVIVQVFRTGDQQDALEIVAAVREYLEQARAWIPEGIELATWNDSSKVLRDRLSLLTRNGIAGFVLVFISLALFLRLRLAFWVSLGIPASFLGALWLMPTLDVTVNLISLFAFIVVLGIVVDDAIIVSENIFTHQERTGRGPAGAIEGAQEVARPVVFAVLTTIAAFVPLLTVEGTVGKVMRVIPLIVIPCLGFSLVESLFVLPAHLSHRSHKRLEDRRGPSRAWRRFQQRFADGLDWVVRRAYRPSLELALRWRYATLAAGVTTLLLTLGVALAGHVRFQFFPAVEADYVSAAVTLPQGSPVETTERAVERLERTAARLREELRAETGRDEFRYTFSAIGEQPFRVGQQRNGGTAASGLSAAHLGEVTIELRPAEERTIGAEAILDRWRAATGDIPDALELDYTASLFSPGDDIDVQLTGPEIEELRAAAAQLEARLREYEGVYEIANSFRAGKREIELEILPAAELAGLTLADLGRQVRQAFYGEEVQRIQRGPDEVRVMVRYPLAERRSLADLERMRIRLPDGLEVPFSEVARVRHGRGFASITRVDRRRAIHVTADVDPAVVGAGTVLDDLRTSVLPEIVRRHDAMRWSFEGQQASQRDTLGGLAWGFLFAAVLIYGLLAVPLRSYVQPLVIMTAIPFGLVGAIWGHVLLGMDLTIMSMFGIVALAGVVVNDSLVMVDFINRERLDAAGRIAAVRAAGAARFRPILLTSLTTFAGLTPLLLERSMQARFLIPMAVSLAFGVVFSTFISLVLVPACYLIMLDLRGHAERFLASAFGYELDEPSAADGSTGAGAPQPTP